MSLKICMIGCGSFARLSHGPAQRKYVALHPDVELAACCDVDENRALEYGQTFGFARHYREIPMMLAAEKPAAVVLAVPPAITCEAASLVLGQGLPLLLEKPPGMRPADLMRLVAVAEKSGARAQVAFNRRYMPVLQRAREIFAADFSPGPPGRIDYEMIRFDRWDADFSTTAIHALDAVLYLAGSPFRTAELRFQDQRQGERGAVNITVEAECVSGTRVQLNIRPVAGRNLESARIHGVGQSLEIRIPFSPNSKAVGCVEHWRGDEIVATFSDGECDMIGRLGVFNETEAFLDAVRSGARFAPQLQECHQQVALMEAIRLRRTGVIEFKTG